MSAIPEVGEQLEITTPIFLETGKAIYGRISFADTDSLIKEGGFNLAVLFISNNEPLSLVELDSDSFYLRKLLKKFHNIQRRDFILPMPSKKCAEIIVYFNNNTTPSIKFWYECARCLRIGGLLSVYEKPVHSDLLKYLQQLPQGLFLEERFEGNSSEFKSTFRRGTAKSPEYDVTEIDKILDSMLLPKA